MSDQRSNSQSVAEQRAGRFSLAAAEQRAADLRGLLGNNRQVREALPVDRRRDGL